ncbi:hypothetical protein ABZW10_36795 [Kitasatospora sp. NPDC004723]|uniref:hypothetical protein n=1 Tax=Kitasatospora sp. NPDC004723 TaxID=3154288 RepID=UPI0033BCA48C
MATDHTINVRFFNRWGSAIDKVVIKFSASKSGIETSTYEIPHMEDGTDAGPFLRHYQTGAFSEEFDYWYVEFVSESGSSGKFWCKNNFSCVLDKDVNNDREAHFWIGGAKQEAYTGFPEGSSGWEDGYNGTPSNDPGSNYTCYVSLEHS